ncbi:MAG: 4-hydroxythreonine-4-phosphate dehydrogenase PdxA [Exilispira sp.]
MNKPIIISFGDPGSINPEILAKNLSFLAGSKNYKIIIGSYRSFYNYSIDNCVKIKKIIGQKFKTFFSKNYSITKIKKNNLIKIAKDFAFFIFNDLVKLENKNTNEIEESSKILFYDPADDLDFSIGKVDIENGFLSYLYLLICCDLIELLNYNCYLLTLPVNKKSISLYDKNFKGHTDFLIERFSSPNSRMLMHSENISILMETNHIPVLNLKKYLNEDHFLSTLIISTRAIDMLKLKPYIYVLGLNPHRSDHSLIGNDEEKWIIPQIKKAERIFGGKYSFSGPISSDSAFTEKSMVIRKKGIYIAWYHDQGLIPFKILAKDKGSNITIGLPFFRISPDHGTGFDIVGKNIANSSSLKFCIETILSLEE